MRIIVLIRYSAISYKHYNFRITFLYFALVFVRERICAMVFLFYIIKVKHKIKVKKILVCKLSIFYDPKLDCPYLTQ